LRERFTPVGVAQAGRPLRVESEDLGADHPHQVTSASGSVPQRTWSGPIPGRAARASPFRRGDVACPCAAPRAPPGAQSGPSRRPRAHALVEPGAGRLSPRLGSESPTY
jgi:hypothetical protein